MVWSRPAWGAGSRHPPRARSRPHRRRSRTLSATGRPASCRTERSSRYRPCQGAYTHRSASVHFFSSLTLRADRYLSAMTQWVFQAGMQHSMVDAKWPAFEEFFGRFDPQAMARLGPTGRAATSSAFGHCWLRAARAWVDALPPASCAWSGRTRATPANRLEQRKAYDFNRNGRRVELKSVCRTTGASYLLAVRKRCT